MPDSGVLAVISGFSGAGKGTVLKSLFAEHPGEYVLSISATTRAPRAGETDGKDYFFIDNKDFEKLIEDDALFEYASYVGNYYGTPKKFVMDNLAAGRDVILEIEMQGAFKVREKYPEAVLIFVVPPDIAELEKRLKGRGTETEEKIGKRLSQAKVEACRMNLYDYILVNREPAQCAALLHDVIRCSRFGARQQTEILSALKKELDAR